MESMDDDEILEFAASALREVSDIAFGLAEDNKSALHSDLATTLYTIANQLEDSPEVQPRRIRKLLKDVEWICRGPKRAPGKGFPRLEALVSGETETAESDIRNGLASFLSRGPKAVASFISHLEHFFRERSSGRDEEAETEPKALSSEPHDYPDRLNIIIHSVLSKYLKCTCNCLGRQGDAENSGHFAVLLLKPAYPCTEEDEVPFDMLISTMPMPKSRPCDILWQDIQLLVSRHDDGTKKRVMFDADQIPKAELQRQLKRIARGKFCELIGQYFEARLQLMIKNQELMQIAVWQPRKQVVQPQPGTPLTAILQNYDLTPRMKVTLSYIIARSVWQFYGSDWMNTRWTSDTIHFMSEAASEAAGQASSASIFAWKPYLAAGFGEADLDFVEPSTIDGAIHRYPRVLALGIMLVEIGVGFPIRQAENGLDEQSLAAKLNRDWASALQYAKSEQARNLLDYPAYWAAAEKCLQPDVLATAPLARESPEDKQKVLDSRRKILYKEVLSPLEGLFQKTGWAEEISTTPAVKPRVMGEGTSAPAAAPRVQSAKQSAKDKTEAKRRADAEMWLSRIDSINQALRAGAEPRRPPYRRVRVAVLDTGYDQDAPFFLLPSTRVKEWKDWADPPSEEAQDSDGHGTHMVSVVARIAPEAEIYVGRVAKDAKSLTNASEKVAEAIAWADEKWEADIISMSFGFEKTERAIDRAISSAVLRRGRQVLFLAAAANYGANAAEMFPARHADVISVRGTSADGRFQDFNPPRAGGEGIVYGTLGQAVPGVSPGGGGGQGGAKAYKSGTSAATAVAAGLAAVALEFVGSRRSRPGAETIRARLGTHQGMRAMFSSLSTSWDEKYNYVAPWRLQSSNDDERWAIVAEAMTRIAW